MCDSNGTVLFRPSRVTDHLCAVSSAFRQDPIMFLNRICVCQSLSTHKPAVLQWTTTRCQRSRTQLAQTPPLQQNGIRAQVVVGAAGLAAAEHAGLQSHEEHVCIIVRYSLLLGAYVTSNAESWPDGRRSQSCRSSDCCAQTAEKLQSECSEQALSLALER